MPNQTFPSSDRGSQIFYHSWLPEEAPKAVLVLFHGMLEHAGRYEDFATALKNAGMAIYAPDHLGHGQSAALKGHFADDYGNAKVVRDMLTMVDIAHKNHPKAPLFLMGHSMGSFLTRQLLHTYTLPHLSGVILMGTGYQPKVVIQFARALTALVAKTKGKRYKSALLHKLIMGSNNARIHPKTGPFAWLTRDEAIASAFTQDPLNGDVFTAQGYNDMFTGILTNYDPGRLAALDLDVPVLITSGDADPIGGYGKALINLYDDYQALGYTDLTLYLYDGARHELFNETNKDEVIQDIYDWMADRI